MLTCDFIEFYLVLSFIKLMRLSTNYSNQLVTFNNYMLCIMFVSNFIIIKYYSENKYNEICQKIFCISLLKF